MRNLIKITAILFFLSFLSFCSKDQNETVMPKPIKIEQGQKRLILADNKLGFDIYRNIKDMGEGNILVSPLGLNKSFGLLSHATKNNFKIKRILNLPKLSAGNFLREINTLNNTIFQLDQFCAFSSTNNFLLNESNSLKKDFNNFFRDVKDFKLTLSKKLRLKHFDIENDISLKCNFKYQTGTAEAPFYLNPNDSKFIEMLVCESEFNYYSDNILKAVEIPIGRGNFSALVIMPETGQTIESIKTRFSPYYLQAINKKFRKLNLSVYMPQLDIDYTFSFTNDLKESGINKMLDNNFAFEGISDEKLYLNNLSQSVKLKTVSKPISNRNVFSNTQNQSVFIDRPFLLLITEKYSGSVVFIGQITNPVK